MTGGSESVAFGLLHPSVQKWIWKQGWSRLRDLQERATVAILQSDSDVILSAATASGKTEAAFLPIISRIAERTSAGIDVLYISPLKALINDQYFRLKGLGELADIPVYRWHGDVPSGRKREVLKGNGGVLLITPESLEALFVLRGLEIPTLFACLEYVVVDELHAFMGTERGKQLQSLVHRVDLATRRSRPRIALSATLGDMRGATEFLRPGSGDKVTVIESEEAQAELLLQLRGYLRTALGPAALSSDKNTRLKLNADNDERRIARHLYQHLRGSDNLIFANSRANVEKYADLLRQLSDHERVPNEFYPHHGNLSKELRETLEKALKDTRPVSAVCTSTLELGIDIGSVHSIAQIGTPPSVSSLRQRLGRSGRREDEAAILRAYLSEYGLEANSEPPDQLRIGLVQMIAMIELLLRGWYEPSNPQALHLSTLVQQFLSVVVQHGGVQVSDAYSALCRHGPFTNIGTSLFAEILRSLANSKVIQQSTDGTILLGPVGERLTGHYSFYAAFISDEEYRITCGGRSLGTLPIKCSLAPGVFVIFAGRRWKVIDVDEHRKSIDVVPSESGRPPVFGGEGGLLNTKILLEMLRIYMSAATPTYLDKQAQAMIQEGRQFFEESRLEYEWIALGDGSSYLLPWTGTAAMEALQLMLMNHGLEEIGLERTYLRVGSDKQDLVEALEKIASRPIPSGVALANQVKNKKVEKYHSLLDEHLLSQDYASARLDCESAWHRVNEIIAGVQPKDLLPD